MDVFSSSQKELQLCDEGHKGTFLPRGILSSLVAIPFPFLDLALGISSALSETY